MTTERGPEALVRAMAEELVPPEANEDLFARRERMVAEIGRAIRQTASQTEGRRRIQRRLSGFAVAAAVALGGFGLHQVIEPDAETPQVAHAPSAVAAVETVSGTLVVTHAGRARVVSEGERPKLVAGDELRTATDGGAQLKTERSAISIAPATQLSVLAPSSAEERIRLAVGRVDLHVSKQHNTPRSVVVETPNAEVVVRGTVFSVAVAKDGNGTNTRVRVTEGSVWVLSSGTREIVSTGEEWSSVRKPVSTQPPAPVPSSAPQTSERSSRDESRRPGARANTVQRTRPGTLADENRMFQAAVDARNRGDDRRAIELFGSLLARHPKSRLAEESRVERMRALRRLGDSARASAEARRYLAEHGSGFAREEAREAALGEK